MIGWSPDAVRSTLGAPTSIQSGRFWASRTPLTGGNALQRNDQGELVPAALFGMLPQRIAPGVAYEEWIFRNVRGSVWILYISGKPQRVVDVNMYPEGAVF